MPSPAPPPHGRTAPGAVGRVDAQPARAANGWTVVPEYGGALNVGQVMRDLAELAAPDAVFTSDAGNFAAWPARFINFGEHQRFIGPTNGAMGYGVPAGIGAAIAYPGRQVIVFVGDGGMLMTGQEIATAFQQGAAPILLVFNNGMYGTIRMYQERTYPGRVSGTALTNPDFAALIESFGGHGEVVSATAEFGPAFTPRGRERPAGADRVADGPGSDHVAGDHCAVACGDGGGEAGSLTAGAVRPRRAWTRMATSRPANTTAPRPGCRNRPA